MKYAWGHKRRFNAFSNYMKSEFGNRVQKVSVNAGFTCPNRDGSKGTGGCTFCNNEAFNPSYCSPELSIKEQIQKGVSFHKRRYRKALQYLVYFQSYSNTYDTVEVLKKRYQEALGYPDVIGLVIGTRPDCVSEEILDYIAELSEEYYITLEFGIESVYDKTLELVNRKHSFSDVYDALQASAQRNIRTGGHFIVGLPGETKEELINSADIISTLKLHSVKFHQLQIFKGTGMAEEYAHEPENFTLFSLEEYLDFMVKFVEKLNPEFIIERIAGETQPENNLGFRWNLRYEEVIRKFEEKLESENTWQGKKYIRA